MQNLLQPIISLPIKIMKLLLQRLPRAIQTTPNSAVIINGPLRPFKTTP